MNLVDKLDAIEEIKKLKARYFRYVDTKDWDALGSVFAPDATIDLSHALTPTDRTGAVVSVGGPPTPPRTHRVLDVEGMVDSARTAFREAVSVHHGHMPEIEVTSADTATGVWPMEDMLIWPEGYVLRRMHGFGHYHEEYVRLPVGWRIKSMRLTRLHIDRDPPGAPVGQKAAPHSPHP